jgi:hypothetical protein
MTSNLSLYIPRVHNKCHMKATEEMFETLAEYMTHVFRESRLGDVSRIDFVPINGKENNFSKAFVHFSKWYDTKESIAMRDLIYKIDSECLAATRFVYEEPYYWILKPNKSRTHDNMTITRLEKQITELTLKITSLSSISAEIKEDYNETPSKRKR